MPDQIPIVFRGVALQAVASGEAQQVAVQLGLSVPALIQECIRLAHDPKVFVENPRACRVILDRLQEARSARSADHLTVRSTV